MVRGKVQMRRIENAINRQVTFSKRRNGLIKKANELSILCDAQVALIVFSQSGRLFEFSSHSDMQKILERYHQYIVKDDPITNNNNKVGEDFMQMQQLIKLDPSSMAKKIELLELYHRNLLGHNYLNSCSYYELQGIENQLVTSLQNIRLRKAQLYMDHIEQLQNKERNMLLENVKLSEMYGPKSSQRAWANNKHREAIAEAFPSSPSIQSSHVETELFIGLPQWRCSYI